MKTINFCLFSLVFIWLYSCSSEDSPIEQPTDAENTWYELSENQLKGWDEGYTDGSGYYITYETDSLCGLQYAYINKNEQTEQQAICFVFNWDYKPLAVQLDSKLYWVDTENQKLASVESAKKSPLERLQSPIKQDITNRVVITSRPTQAAGSIANILSIPDFLDLIQNLAEHDISAFLTNVTMMGFGKFIPTIPGIIITINALNERYFEIPHYISRIYGEANPDIYQIEQKTHSNQHCTLQAMVEISGIESIPDFYLDAGKHDVYVGVIVLEGPQILPEPRLDYCHYKSDERLIQKEIGGGLQQQFENFDFLLSTDKSYYFRPYIRSSQVDKEGHSLPFIRYGKTIYYNTFKSGITDVNIIPEGSTLDQIYFHGNVTATMNNSEDIQEWGVYLEENGYRSCYTAPQGASAFVQEIYTKYSVNEMDLFDYTNHIAKKRIQLDTWFRRNIIDVQNGLPEYEYSPSEEYVLVYDQPASVEFTNYEVFRGPYPATSYDPETGKDVVIPGSAWYDYYLHFTVTGAPFINQAFYHIDQYEYGPADKGYANGLIYSGESPIVVSDGDNVRIIRQLSSTIPQDSYNENWEYIILETSLGRIVTDKSLHYFHNRANGLSFTSNIDIE